MISFTFDLKFYYKNFRTDKKQDSKMELKHGRLFSSLYSNFRYLTHSKPSGIFYGTYANRAESVTLSKLSVGVVVDLLFNVLPIVCVTFVFVFVL